MLTISDVENALEKHFETELITDSLKIKNIKGTDSVLVTIDEVDVIIECKSNEQSFVHKIPVDEFVYCKEADDKEIYMLRLFCRKCEDFLHCASVKKSLSECVGSEFTPIVS